MDSRKSGAECYELNEVKKKNIDNYDAIIYVGWACPGGFNYDATSITSKLMMKMFIKAL